MDDDYMAVPPPDLLPDILARVELSQEERFAIEYHHPRLAEEVIKICPM